MPKRIIFIILVVLLVIGGGFLWRNFQKADLENKEESEAFQPQDEIEKLLFNLKSQTELGFSSIKPIVFQWNAINQEEEVVGKTINGKRIELQDASQTDESKVASYFQENGFVIDKYNLADGVTGSLAGYKKERMVCQISSLMRLNEQGLPLASGIGDLSINCAKVDFDPSPELSAELLIKKILANKYDKKVAEISLQINQQTENYLRGEVVFQPSGSENSGIFLAAKVGEDWELVFDGNGSFSCDLLKNYDFPEDMQTGCFSSSDNQQPVSN